MDWRYMAATLLAVVTVVIWQRPVFESDVPTLQVALVAIAIVFVARRQLGLVEWSWWLWGLASLAWSLTPGSTFVAVLWSSVYLAALAVPQRVALYCVAILLLGNGLFSVLSLRAFGMLDHFSGSVAYLTGAIALLVLPQAIAWIERLDRWWMWVLANLLMVAAILAVLSSGSRAIIIAFGALVPVALMMPTGMHRRYRKLLAGLVVAAALVFALDTVLPGPSASGTFASTIRESLPFNWREVGGTDVAPTGSTVGKAGVVPPAVEGSLATRLKMWDQAARIGLSHPLGTGLGSFAETIQGFQRYPTINFSSAHNAILQVFATQGWVGLVLLYFVLASNLIPGVKSANFRPLSLGTMALFFTMLLDITWSMPSMVLLLFWASASSRPGQRSRVAQTHRSKILRFFPTIAVAAVAACWYLPWQPTGTLQHMGYRGDARRTLSSSATGDVALTIETLKSLYPRSLWVWSAAVEHASTDEARLISLQELVDQFPIAYPEAYTQLAETALRLGRNVEAKRALEQGLAAFPPSVVPAGIPYASVGDQFVAWRGRVAKMLEDLGMN